MNSPTRKKYIQEAIPLILEKTSTSNVLAVPCVEKAVVNVGIGKFRQDKEAMEEIVQALTAITGQRPVKTKAKRSIAGFKTRTGSEVGVKVTLRGARMWQFLDRLIHVALPRVRDFQGLASSVVDANGNINIGIREHTVFPEVVTEQIKNIFSLQVTVTTKTVSREHSLILLRALNFPVKTSQ